MSGGAGTKEVPVIVVEGHSPDAPPVLDPPSRLKPVLAILLAWLVLWFFLRGIHTLALEGRPQTDIMKVFAGWRDALLAGRTTNPVMQMTGALADGLRSLVAWLQTVVSVPAPGRPVPSIGWLGVTALATWAAAALANLRVAALTLVTFVLFGVLGQWTYSLDLLIVVLVSVALSVLIGLPLAVLLGTNRRARTLVEPVLDVFQTMPAFVYLAPLALFFGIGSAGAIMTTVVYAVPPLIRIGAHGIRGVSPQLIEVTDSLGQTRWQRLFKVQLPLARKTLVVGLNQTTMAALSMAIIASFIDGPGLGKPVVAALQTNDVGGAVVPGLLIVLMAIMLDRVTTATNERSEKAARALTSDRRRRWVLVGAGLAAAVAAVVVSRQYFWAASWDKLLEQALPGVNLRRVVADHVSSGVTTFTDAVGPSAGAFKDAFTYALLNPLQAFLAESPWWLAAAAILALAYVLGGTRALAPVVVCLAGIVALTLWNEAMITLAMTLVATIVVMALAVVLGVAMARSKPVDSIVRPVLDAAQTIPAFVFIIPMFALFGASRLTAIVAAIVYAVPVATKLVADGVRGVSPTTMEAVRSQGATTMQEITQAQLPMAKSSLVLAANQGLLYVLSMTVIGGMVGAGALGYAVVLGFSRSEEWGRGLAAGLTIVLLGILLDKITRHAAQDRGTGITVAKSADIRFGRRKPKVEP